MKPSESFRALRDQARAIAERYPMLANVRIFGSVARGDDNDSSDIDVVVTPLPDADLLDIGFFAQDLEELFGVHIDILSSRPLSNTFMEKLESKSIPL